MVEVILASKSPRRQKLLRNLIDHFFIINSGVEEFVIPDEKPEEFVLRLAKDKAIRVSEKMDLNPDQEILVIGTDTIVVDGSEILGKPVDDIDARRILEQLKGKEHQVLSGIVIYQFPGGQISSRLIRSNVMMREYSGAEIDAYIATGDPFDKAGAYAIQNHSFNPVPDFQGCYANVMGLPVCDLYGLIKGAGHEANESVAENCQASIQYQCPVFKKRLSFDEE